ncbi:MAG: CoA transferase [Rhodocyclaceae bacterium]|nr:MAG: CoA transferase [Rhodocyclaceae bacterium]
MDESAVTLPLGEIRIIDLTHALSGPFATFHLALMGAEVIKIEPPGRGDEFRDWRPTIFAQANAGKRSITLDLKRTAGREALHRLIAGADVVIENFRPGVALDLGLDWNKLKLANPQLIYCSVSGYGQSGELRDRPAIEWSVQAMSGVTSLYVEDDSEPRTLGLTILDPFSGYMAYAAVMAAILQRQKTKQGQRLDVSMFDAAWVLNSSAVVDVMAGLTPVPLVKRANAARFMASDRRLFISFVWPKWFSTLCEVLDAPELLTDQRFKDNASMQANGEALIEEIERRLASRTAEEWATELTRRGVPASPICTLDEAAALSQVRERKLLEATTCQPGGKPVDVVGAGVVFEHDSPRLRGPVPELGEFTEQALLQVGYDMHQIESLRTDGVI